MADIDDSKLQTLRQLNSCYEALFDLRCIFPSWSEFKDNFFFHWKLVMNYRNNETLPFYLETLGPIISSQGNLPTELSLGLVTKLDDHRRKLQSSFICENLEKILEKDAKISTGSSSESALKNKHLDKLSTSPTEDQKRKRTELAARLIKDNYDPALFPSRKGVYYDKARMLWRAYWKQDGRVITKGFSVAEYKTHEEARRKAIMCREMKEREFGIAA